ncbi:MAG TPA: lysine exporter LysO family protein [Marinilabiliaceae bacterium]|nr:lysine exporter LysO family protein [Marinilabiliaceae bacterium]
MKSSIIIISFFILGVLLGRFDLLPAILQNNDFSIYALYVLMFLVGISIGSDEKAIRAIRNQNLKIFLIPLGTIVGTLLGVYLISFLLKNRSATDCLAIGSGFGYYSLSSLFITEYKGAEMGVIALISNIIRELFTLLFAPLLVVWFGKLAPISAGGATTADTTLPIITKFSGKEFVVIAITHGILVDFTVPFLVVFFCKI